MISDYPGEGWTEHGASFHPQLSLALRRAKEEYEFGKEVMNFLPGGEGERHYGSLARRMWDGERMEEGESLWEKLKEAGLDFVLETTH